MALQEYKKKRSFKNTPEPTGGTASGEALQFVIQKHAASRLHYDFRIEIRGVLKSWAVPKGPSMNPSDKRLAMLVEDHPYDYKDFEGNIPAGNYGAGTVIIWDHGTYEPTEPLASKEDNEKLLLKSFHAGQLKIRLNGQKLKGEFVLVKTPTRAENAWLLIKHRDEFASKSDITEMDRSVVSNRTIEETSEDKDSKEWKSNRTTKTKSPAKKPAVSKKKSTAKKVNKSSTERMKGVAGEKSVMPTDIKPMLATLSTNAIEDTGWLYEVKWDGYRALAYCNNTSVEIKSRNNKPFDKKFYPIHQALVDWNVKAVVDGEIVVVNKKGLPDFEALQTWRSEADGELMYFLFDILWADGVNLMNVPLQERKRILKEMTPTSGAIRLSDNFDITGSDFFDLAGKMGLEGIMAKRADSLYLPDTRSKDWLKIKVQKHQEVVIGGYTRNDKTSRKISALLLGVYDKGEFVFIGPVGTGFTTKMQEEILERLKPLETKVCPFNEVPEYNKPSRFRPNPPEAKVTWVKPQVVAEISYRTTASDGTYRHPSFRGIRDDKSPDEVQRESPAPESVSRERETGILKSKGIGQETLPERKSLLNPTDETQVRTIDGHDIKFTNLSKVFWSAEKFTKRDMLNYYYQAAPFMLPYYQGRPQTLNRFPNGIEGKSFYQKDVTGKVPDWIATHKYYSETDQREKQFLVCTDDASLLYIASLGCIEINPWSSRTDKPDNPDWCIIDLDPDKNPFEQVIEAARVTHEVLNALGIPSFCKTSGSTGLHIYIPLGAKYTYEDSKEFGRAIVKIVNAEIPSFTSIERLTANRKGKIYLDFLQNRPQATVAGPYSLRPKPGAPVSMPLHWDEVKKGLKILDFNLKNAVARMKNEGDLFQGVLGEGINMKSALAKMERVFGGKISV